VQIGGTSAATPLTAAILAVTGQAGVGPQFFYENVSTSLNDVTSGNNGTCSTAYFCNGEVGYDGPTGNGTPIGSAWAGTTPPPPTDAGSPPPPVDSSAPSGNLLTNGDFSTGTLADWSVAQGSVTIVPGFAQGTSANSVRIGSKTAFSGYAILDHQFTVPSSGTTTLSYWGSYICPDKSTAEWERVRILSSSKVALATISEECDNTRPWTQTTADLTPYAGQTIYLQFTAHDDNTAAGDRAFWYLSNASITNE
jgi:subtilase family serine protease